MTQAEQHYIKMTQTPVEKLIASLAVPTIISMLISNIYNLADTYFVGSLGVSASGAVGIVFTLMNILQAIGFMLGHGSGSVISRLLADKDIDTASRYISSSFFMALGFGILFIILGIPMVNPLMRLLGSTETILPYARTYGYFILASAPMMIGSLVLNNVLRYEGKALYGMIGLSLGGILNIIGDPLLIYGFGMGIDGAGLATAASQTISFILLIILFRKHAQSRISIRRFGSGRIIGDIITTGFPNLFRQGLTSISSSLVNHAAGVFGDACVSAMAITSRCVNFMNSIALGICQGFQPVAGFNYQAKKYLRLRQAFRFTLIVATIILTVFGCAGLIFAPQVIGLFQSDAQVIVIGAKALRFASISLMFAALSHVPSMMFQTAGQKKPALLLACLRGGLCLIPLILVLPKFMGLTGVQISQPAAELIASLISFPFAVAFFRKIPKEDM